MRIKHKAITLRTHKYVTEFRIGWEIKFLQLYLSLNNTQMPPFQCSLREGRPMYNVTYYKGSIGSLFRLRFKFLTFKEHRIRNSPLVSL